MKVTFKCYIESRTEAWIEEYTLDEQETVEWAKLTDAEREQWKDDWAETAFLNACSYGAALEVEES